MTAEKINSPTPEAEEKNSMVRDFPLIFMT